MCMDHKNKRRWSQLCGSNFSESCTQARMLPEHIGGQSKKNNLRVCSFHFRYVWETIVDEGVKNCNQMLFLLSLWTNEEPRPSFTGNTHPLFYIQSWQSLSQIYQSFTENDQNCWMPMLQSHSGYFLVVTVMSSILCCIWFNSTIFSRISSTISDPNITTLRCEILLWQFLKADDWRGTFVLIQGRQREVMVQDCFLTSQQSAQCCHWWLEDAKPSHYWINHHLIYISSHCCKTAHLGK